MITNPYESPGGSNATTSKANRDSANENTAARKNCGFKSALLGVGVWQLASFAMFFVYRSSIGQFVVPIYVMCFGDIQASYGRFDRFATYIAIFVITLSATIATLFLVDQLLKRRTTMKRKLFTVVFWQVTVMLLLVWSHEVAFPYMVSQLSWRLFGPPTEIYSFQNLVLPRITAWLLCTVPVAWLAVLMHSRPHDT